MWPGYFSSLEAAQPIPQTGHAPSEESWASIREGLPTLAELLPGCTVPTRFVHGELDPLPVTASTDTAELLGAVVDVLPGNGHFPWLEDPGCVRRSLDALLLRERLNPRPVGECHDSRARPLIPRAVVKGMAATLAMPMRTASPAASVPAIVIYRQEVRPMYAVSAVGAPPQSTIARLR